MPPLGRMMLHGAVLTSVSTLVLLACLIANPRLLLEDYPADVQRAVPPKTDRERRTALLVGVPFLGFMLLFPAWSTWTQYRASGTPPTLEALFLNTFVVASAFNAFDLLVLDWLLFCTLRPRFIVLPGTEGMPGYRDYFFHFRGFLIGTALSAALAVIVAVIVRVTS